MFFAVLGFFLCVFGVLHGLLWTVWYMPVFMVLIGVAMAMVTEYPFKFKDDAMPAIYPPAEATARLRRSASRLRIGGWVAMAGLAGVAGSGVFSWSLHRYLWEVSLLAFINILVLVFRDKERRAAESLISNGESRSKEFGRAARDFDRMADMPVISGRYGQAWYVLLNLLGPILLQFVLAFGHRPS